MSKLTSRPQAPLELITKSGVVVRITLDYDIDPPELRIVQEAVWPYPEETLLVKRADEAITMFELISVIDQLGFPVNYEELP